MDVAILILTQNDENLHEHEVFLLKEFIKVPFLVGMFHCLLVNSKLNLKFIHIYNSFGCLCNYRKQYLEEELFSDECEEEENDTDMDELIPDNEPIISR